jgi:hypothetical protein
MTSFTEPTHFMLLRLLSFILYSSVADQDPVGSGLFCSDPDPGPNK